MRDPGSRRRAAGKWARRTRRSMAATETCEIAPPAPVDGPPPGPVERPPPGPVEHGPRGPAYPMHCAAASIGKIRFVKA